MKTAMQELIEDLLSGKITDTLARSEYYLEKEKQQIIDAFVAGDNSCCTSEENSEDYANHYFNETYNTK